MNDDQESQMNVDEECQMGWTEAVSDGVQEDARRCVQDIMYVYRQVQEAARKCVQNRITMLSSNTSPRSLLNRILTPFSKSLSSRSLTLKSNVKPLVHIFKPCTGVIPRQQIVSRAETHGVELLR